MAACAAVLAAAGCGGGAGSSSAPGLPAGASQSSLRRPAGDTITEYVIPRRDHPKPKTFPVGITLGPDGNMWFAERGLGKLGSIATDGQFHRPYNIPYNVTGPARFPQNVTTGPDGYLWAVTGSTRRYTQESNGVPDQYGAVVRMNPATGQITQTWALPMFSDPRQITTGPDGNMWFTQTSGFIGRIRLRDGQLKEFKIPHHNAAYGIVLGPDGNLWFAESSHDLIGRITITNGKVKFTMFPCPSPTGLVVGPDGKTLWATAFLNHKIVQVDMSGAILQEVELPAGSSPKGIAVGGDGNLYVADFGTGKIAVVNPAESPATLLAKLEPPTHHSGPWIIAPDRDGNIWFTESLSGDVAKITLSAKP